MSRLTKAGMLFAQRTHMNRRRAAVSHIVSGVLIKFLISNEDDDDEDEDDEFEVVEDDVGYFKKK